MTDDAATGEEITLEALQQFLLTLPDTPNPGPYRFYAAGPNSERWARRHLLPGIEIVRMDRLS